MPATPTPKAYSYIRFSTPEQQKGDSDRRQTELSRKYAEANGLTLDENLTYRDLGVSAFDKSNIRNGELGAFLRAIDSGAVEPGSYLLVESLDRLSRAKVTDALEVFMSIINRGIRLVTLADGREYSKEKINEQFTELIISIVVMSRAHEESLTKSRRLKEAWKAKRGRIGDAKLTEIAPAWLKLNEDRTAYDLVPDRVELVQRMFEWSKDGIGSETIARRLNQQDVPNWGTRSADQWHASYIKKILDNRAVLGEFQPHTIVDGKRVPEGDPAPDYFPRIVSDEDFVLAKAARLSRRTNSAGRKGETFSNLFSGILRCGYCNGTMIYVNKGHDGPRGRLLVCTRAKAGKGCHYVPWEYPQFERSVLTYCKGLDFDAFLQTRDTVKSELSALSARIALLESSLAGNKQKQTNILDAIESGAKFQQFEARMVQLERERTSVEAELDDTRQKYDLRANATVDVISEIMPHYVDVDGNFVEQFQTTGFDARVWELYLYSYLVEEQLFLNRDFDRPDFLVTKYGKSVAIEATIVGRSKDNPPSLFATSPTLPDPAEIKRRQQDELPIKFGSPLYSKLQKKYWNLDHVKGLPLVFAVADFHDDQSMLWSSTALINYLYGVRHDFHFDNNGQLVIEPIKIDTHKVGKKEIPSGFFFQPEAEHVSAVMFSASGTISKFNRMGRQAGFVAPGIIMIRAGTHHDHNPNAHLPKPFFYYVTEESNETWAEGLSMFHNPNALHPVPEELFPSIAHHRFQDGQIVSLLPEFHPYASQTIHMKLRK